MKHISAVTIGKLIEAHMEHDEEKFLSYANFIADAYGEADEERSASYVSVSRNLKYQIIRSKISKEYTKFSKVSIDSDVLLKLLQSYIEQNYQCRPYPYTIHDGRRYEGTIYITEGIGFHDGQGNKIEFR